MTGWEKDPSVREWMRDVLENMVPKLDQSAFTMSLVPHAGKRSEGDVKFWVELGASIMLDKPIVLVVFDNRELPERLRRVADEIVTLDYPIDDPRGAVQLERAVERVLERLEQK